MKPLIIYSSKNIASKTLAEQLDGTIDSIDVADDIVRFTPPKTNHDYFIVLSSHTSRSNTPSATVHVPGNWGKAELGGEDNRLSMSYPSKMLDILKGYAELKDRGYEITFEVDHHGPTFDKPVMFVELGSDEKGWRDKEAAKVIIKSVMNAIDMNNEYDVYFGIDGTHYLPKLTKYALEHNISYAHLLARYQEAGFREEMFIQAIKLSIESVEGIMLAKKGVDGEKREFIRKFAERYGIDLKIV